MVKVKKNLSGMKFGRLTVIEQVEDSITPKGQHLPMWKCICDCGTEIITEGGALKTGHTKSCGCLTRTNRNLINQKFGEWTVIGKATDYIKPDGRHEPMWLCVCSCGVERAVHEQNLISGKSSSCGHVSVEASKHLSTYDLESKEYGIGTTYNGDQFLFDKEDYEKIKAYSWRKANRGYIIANLYNDPNGKTVINLHRLVMNVGEYNGVDNLIDHKNGDTSDNRKSNLRIATQHENGMNLNVHSSNNTGILGVRKVDGNKYEAKIFVNGKSIQARFDNIEDAIAERRWMEERYFGEWARNANLKEENT